MSEFHALEALRQILLAYELDIFPGSVPLHQFTALDGAVCVDRLFKVDPVRRKLFLIRTFGAVLSD